MNSLSLPPDQFWFYRVLMEWTLGILHRVNNELTGALFLIEQIQENFTSSELTPLDSQNLLSSLSTSIQKIHHLISEAAALHTPPSQQISDPITPHLAVREASSIARLLLPKSIKILEPTSLPESNSCLFTSIGEFRLLAAAAALILHPISFRSKGSFSIHFSTHPNTTNFLPQNFQKPLFNYQHINNWLISFQLQLEPTTNSPIKENPSSASDQFSLPSNSPNAAFQAIHSRISSIGGAAEFHPPYFISYRLPSYSSYNIPTSKAST
ncbi:MAG: hypothetical protein N2035_02200 [Chthoniobacterales bacterium]|nr:hypothetical protein [Chthoniobacterales bacterium]